MSSAFITINGGGAAQVHAQQVPGQQISASTNRVEKSKRRRPTPPDTTKLARQVHELNGARRRGSLEWPAGITHSNTILDKVKRSVPKPLANKGNPHESDEDEFILCAAASDWPHIITAAYLGRSPQAVRLILHRLRTAREDAERAAEQSTETTEGGPSQSASAATDSDATLESSPVSQVGQMAESGRLPEPSSSSPVAGPLRDSSDEQPQSSNSSISYMTAAELGSRMMPLPSSSPPSAGPSWTPVQQPNGWVVYEPAGQTTFDRQVVNATTDPVPTGSSNMVQRDRSGMNVLAEAAVIHSSGYQNALAVMGIVQG
jgi:hypothetical protein